MNNSRCLFRLAVLAVCVAAPAEVASAAAMNATVPTQAETPAPAPLSAEELSLQGFGAQTAGCLEWSDSCSICERDETGAMKCSTPESPANPRRLSVAERKSGGAGDALGR